MKNENETYERQDFNTSTSIQNGVRFRIQYAILIVKFYTAEKHKMHLEELLTEHIT